MTNIARTIIGVVLFSGAAPGPAVASPYLWWQLHPVGADATERGLEYRYYASQAELTFKFVLKSEDTTRPVVVDGSLLPRVGVTVTRGGRDIPIETGWGLTLRHAREDSSEMLPASARLVLDADNWMETSVVLRLTDGSRFQEGEYVVSVSMEPYVSTIQFGSGEVWKGRYVPAGSVRLHVRPAASLSDRKRQLTLEASLARARGDLTSAIDRYKDLTELDPADWRAYAGLGMVLVDSGRFADGVVALEKVLPFVLGEKSSIPHTLAYAHIALGNEVRARSILRMVVAPGRIDDEIKRLRAAVERRKRR